MSLLDSILLGSLSWRCLFFIRLRLVGNDRDLLISFLIYSGSNYYTWLLIWLLYFWISDSLIYKLLQFMVSVLCFSIIANSDLMLLSVIFLALFPRGVGLITFYLSLIILCGWDELLFRLMCGKRFLLSLIK